MLALLVTKFFTNFVLTESQLMLNCMKINRKKARIPSNNTTFLFKATEAKQEPRAMVTIKSKAFILESVLFPKPLNRNIKAIYARMVITVVLMILSQLLKKRWSMLISFKA